MRETAFNLDTSIILTNKKAQLPCYNHGLPATRTIVVNDAKMPMSSF